MAISAGTLAFLFLLAFSVAPVHAAGAYSVFLQTDQSSYSGAQSIKITGTITPPPGPNTAVIITVKNSAGSVADINEVTPSSTNGSFSDVSIAGGNSAWVSGMFSVNATWGGDGATATNFVTFSYSSTPATITTTIGTTTTTTTIPTTPAPEFPSGVLAAVTLVGMAGVAILSRRIALRPVRYVGP